MEKTKEIEKELSPNRSIEQHRRLMWALFALMLLFLYKNIYPVSAQLTWLYFEKGYSSFFMRNLPPIGLVVLIGYLLKLKMAKTTEARMVKVLITWLGSVFIFYIIHHFHLRKIIFSYFSKGYIISNSQGEPEWLILYFEPLFYPLVMAIILYLVVLGLKRNNYKEL